MHIPKTAGTAIRAALADRFAPDERLYLYPSADMDGAVDPHRFSELPAETRSRLRFIMGHFYFGLHRLVPGPSRYLTMLRDPLDRVVSLYYHYKVLAAPREGSRGYEEQLLIARSEMSLEEWVFTRARPEADNAMVRAIAGRGGVPFGKCPSGMLDEALAHIDEHFEAVLIQERMATSLGILESIVGARLDDLPHANVNPGRPPTGMVDPQLATRIRDLNALDVELYRTCLERLPAALPRLAG
jgi:hypothetical protein